MRPRALPRPRPSQGRLKIESRVALSPRSGASQRGCGGAGAGRGGSPAARVPVVGGGPFSARASRSDARAAGPDARDALRRSAVRFVVRRTDRAHSLRRPRRHVGARSAPGRDGESVCLQSVACPFLCVGPPAFRRRRSYGAACVRGESSHAST